MLFNSSNNVIFVDPTSCVKLVLAWILPSEFNNLNGVGLVSSTSTSENRMASGFISMFVSAQRFVDLTGIRPLLGDPRRVVGPIELRRRMNCSEDD